MNDLQGKTPPKLDLAEICPELAELYDRNKWLRRGRAYKIAHDKAIEAIVQTMPKLVEENERLKGKRKPGTKGYHDVDEFYPK